MRSGAKVGWERYDNEHEANYRSIEAQEQAEEMASRGYDFGYQVPGEIQNNGDGTWTVTVP